MAEPNPPVIVIGMHRSGTTMITDMLQRLGLYMGWVLQENSEALFFVERNERLLNACGGSWEFPEPVENLLSHRAMRERAGARLMKDMESVRFASYLGPSRLWGGGRQRMQGAWGWKDPRNTYLLPLWLDLFPKARIIHIYRHPMDVACSLHARECRSAERRVARLGGKAMTVGEGRGGASRNGAPPHSSALLTAYRLWRSAQGRMNPLRGYDKFGISATTSYEAGLRLWAAYVGKCHEHLERYENASISLKYEDFLTDPKPHLSELCDFCRLDLKDSLVEEACAKVRPDRRFAYRKKEEACRIFDAFRDNRWVRHCGYDKD